jgi:DNA-binding CsgD family transcriptional regulator
MKQRRRIYYSAAQRSEIWDRWQAGEPMSSIGRRFDRESSSVFSVISPTGGIRPPARRRARKALSLTEREEISRGLSTQCSLRLIARQLRRSVSTISREVSRNGGSDRCGNPSSDRQANRVPKETAVTLLTSSRPTPHMDSASATISESRPIRKGKSRAA